MEKEKMILPVDGREGSSLSDWGEPVKVAVCENCDWQFIFPETQTLPQCPHCFKPALVNLAQETRDHLTLQSPELILATTLSSGQLTQIFQSFLSGFWFHPVDLKLTNLMNRLILLYLPIWLVDSSIQATWQAEAGFDYQILSHQDRFDENRGGWTSQEVQETRVRWESRLGRLQRVYQNVTAPALNEHSLIMRQLGQFVLTHAKPFGKQSGVLPGGGWVACMPNRGTTDAWPEALLGFQSFAAKECQKACRADHLRNFSWSPGFSGQNWTFLLLPVFSTFYVDDEGGSRPLLVNGQSGKLSGVRRASLKQAQKISLLMLGGAVLVVLLSLLISVAAVVFPFLLILGGIGIVLALLIGLSALAPLIIIWRMNQKSQSGN